MHTQDQLHTCTQNLFAILTVTEGGKGCVAFLLKIQRYVSRPCCERVCYCLCDHRTVLMTWNIHSICFCFGLVLDLDTCVSGPPASSLLADPIHSPYFRMSEFLALDISWQHCIFFLTDIFDKFTWAPLERSLQVWLALQAYCVSFTYDSVLSARRYGIIPPWCMMHHFWPVVQLAWLLGS